MSNRTAADIATRLRALPQAQTDPMIRSIADALDRDTIGEVFVRAVVAYSDDAARLRKIAADAVERYGHPVSIRLDNATSREGR